MKNDGFAEKSPEFQTLVSKSQDFIISNTTLV